MKLEKLMKKLVKLEGTLWTELEKKDGDIKSDDSLYEADKLMTSAYFIMQRYLNKDES